ncbi:hypothetical protein [Spiroplasma endosymbiont of Aspidapion aeneum]|uniref:hypothetical protein n=1 Tax=Spiroplasma endosymbiont of Aspidapion aeneum TaxID=3066276 RepID=UPI00313BF355
MKKNWLLSTILFFTLFVGLIVFTQFVGFDINVKLGNNDNVKFKFVGLQYDKSFNNDIVTDFSTTPSKSISYLSKFVDLNGNGIFSILTSKIWALIVSLICLSGAGFIYSIFMLFFTDKFDFNEELVVGIFYALIAAACVCVGICVFVSWYYFVQDLNKLNIYSGSKISSSYLSGIFIIIGSTLPIFSYIWKLIVLLKSE